jgi:hypothetical protein
VVSRYGDGRFICIAGDATDLCENFNRTMVLARHEWVQLLGVDDVWRRIVCDDGQWRAGRGELQSRLSVVLAGRW